jgi:hypothetical protein
LPYGLDRQEGGGAGSAHAEANPTKCFWDPSSRDGPNRRAAAFMRKMYFDYKENIERDRTENPWKYSAEDA